MTEIYFKNRHTYQQGNQAKDYTYYRIRSDGSITVVSMSRKTIFNR
jgi:hypothetical protein